MIILKKEHKTQIPNFKKGSEFAGEPNRYFWLVMVVSSTKFCFSRLLKKHEHVRVYAIGCMGLFYARAHVYVCKWFFI